MTRRALVLTAGLGTRLRPLTYVRAKAAVPVNGEPLARRVIAWLVAQGVTDLVLNLHHHPASITRLVGDGSDLGARVRYSWEDPVLGSAGGPRRALPLLTEGGHDSVLLVNGDTLTDVDLGAVQATHARTRRARHDGAHPQPEARQVRRRPRRTDGFVSGFTRPGRPGSPSTSSGSRWPNARSSPISRTACRPSRSTRCTRGSSPRTRAPSPRTSATRGSATSARRPTAWRRRSSWRATRGGPDGVGPRRRVDATARVERTALWDDVTVGPGAELRECIVADGVVIPAGARYSAAPSCPPANGRPARVNAPRARCWSSPYD
jgi:CTP:molybdopterin cytidylyltransferase MocA